MEIATVLRRRVEIATVLRRKVRMIVSRCWILERARKESEKVTEKPISELRFVSLFFLYIS